MRTRLDLARVIVLAQIVVCIQVHAQNVQLPIPPSQLVREVVYNELHDHERHGYWRYWIERNTPKESLLEEQVETAEGPIMRLELKNGRPLDAANRLAEEGRLSRLLNSPEEQARHGRHLPMGRVRWKT